MHEINQFKHPIRDFVVILMPHEHQTENAREYFDVSIIKNKI